MDVTWRMYLDELVRRMSAAEKQQLYQTVQVTRTTFQRWRKEDTLPDTAHIHLLLGALPEPERERLRALMLDDPKMRALLPAEAVLPRQAARPADKIPQDVYEEVFQLARDAPDRFWLLCSTILLHALTQLETRPTQTGMELSVARCMPPRPDGKIRSLRAAVSRGTPPWRGDLHTQDYFFGAESLAGTAVMHRHGLMIPDLLDTMVIAPPQRNDHERSAAAYPIMREGSIAGALVVSSCVPDFFTRERLTLIEHYADLIRLAFYDQEFYPAACIDLALMPAWAQQQPALRTFRQRVNEEYKRAVRQEQSLQDLAKVELHVRATLEEELMHLASCWAEGDPDHSPSTDTGKTESSRGNGL
ncbi:MAG TPA: GAF domain-containing protein [Ktedonobacteraceae bacterium]|nr:GAF domain-containing protein [Ktedonobacteraceae bacterium]